MYILVTLLSFIALVAAVLGLFKPGLVVPFLAPEKRTRLKAFGLYAAVFILCVLLLPVFAPKDESDAYLAQLKEEAKQSEAEYTKKRETARHWYEGGALHKSTVAQWKKSSQANKLATAADWVIAVPKIRTLAEGSSNMDVIKPYAQELVLCVDKATDDHTNADQSNTAELAAVCMALMGYLE
jgi:hypothetical protein